MSARLTPPAFAAGNITTNELANQHRYHYLRSKDGGFVNPCVPPPLPEHPPPPSLTRTSHLQL